MDNLIAQRIKFFYSEVSTHIKADTLNLKFSDKCKSIDDYLIGYNRWILDKKETFG